MNNIATVYRFNTPFLDLKKEKSNLISVIKKVEKLIKGEGIGFNKNIEDIGKYNKITLIFDEKLGEIEFFNIKDEIIEYYLPVFKLNIFLKTSLLEENEGRKRMVNFLTNIFECFDGLTEKEFLIDLNNNLYYKKGFFNTKYYPQYDFSDIENIRKSFENKGGLLLVKDFITKFSKSNFELTIEKSKYFYKLHSIFLYFVYLIFIMYQNIEKSSSAKKELEEMKDNGLYEEQRSVMLKRLSYMKDLELATFEKYKNRLELFFKLF